MSKMDIVLMLVECFVKTVLIMLVVVVVYAMLASLIPVS